MSAILDPRQPAGEVGGIEAPLRRTFSLVRGAGARLALTSVLGACAVGAGIGLIATSAWLISRASQRPPESALALAIVGVQFFGLSRGLFRYGQRVVGHDAAFRALAKLRVRSYERLESLAPAGLPEFHSGDVLARVVHDVDSLQDLLLRVIPPFVIAVMVGLATVSLVWWILPAAGVILLVALVLAATLATWLTGRLARRSEFKQADSRGQLTAAVVDLLEGAPELVAYGALGSQLQRAATIDGELTRIAAASARTAGVGQGVAVLLSGLAMWGALLLGVAAVHAGVLDGVLLAVIVLVPLAAFEIVTDLPAAAQTLQRTRRAVARTLQVVEAPAPVVDPSHPLPVPKRPCGLAVRGLCARHRPDGPWVIAGLDLDLDPGRTVALVGRSGAGKSTLADVLLRFLPYEQGSVTLGGVEISELCADEYRREVGLLTQDAHIFDATLEENLLLARRNATAAELSGALGGAQLLDWIETLPAGLATPAGPHGLQMSGGQRQRLAIARALLAGFPLLIVDEPGEHLDTATADALVADLLATTPEQSVLLITHRLAGLDAVDEIIVLEGGRAVQRGAHAQLLRTPGPYARMWARETEGL